MSFEAALAQLEDIVDKLERGDVPLEESIAMYERGNHLKSHCEAKLQAAQTRIEKVIPAGDGTVATAPADLD